jgi:hypothetical protein
MGQLNLNSFVQLPSNKLDAIGRTYSDEKEVILRRENGSERFL